MAVVTREIRLKTRGYNEVYDIAPRIQESLKDLSIKDGIITVCGEFYFKVHHLMSVRTLHVETGS